jgi:hypothetical protein
MMTSFHGWTFETMPGSLAPTLGSESMMLSDIITYAISAS